MNKVQNANATQTIHENLRLIQAYRERPVLWDPDYHGNGPDLVAMKDQAWTEVSKIMSIDVVVCIQRMVMLIDSYRRKKAYVEKCKQNGKTPKFRCYVYDAMSFLADMDNERKRVYESMAANIEDDDDDNYNPATKIPSLQLRCDPDPPTIEHCSSKITPQIESKEIKSFTDFVAYKMLNYKAHVRKMLRLEINEIFNKADKNCLTFNNASEDPNIFDGLCNNARDTESLPGTSKAGHHSKGIEKDTKLSLPVEKDEDIDNFIEVIDCKEEDVREVRQYNKNISSVETIRH